MAKSLHIYGGSEVFEMLGEYAGLYGDNGGDPDGNAWLPSSADMPDELMARVEAARLGFVTDVKYANDDAMLAFLNMAPLADGEELEDETVERMKEAAEEKTADWAHYGAYGGQDSVWVFEEHEQA